MRGNDGIAISCERGGDAAREAIDATLTDVGVGRSEARTELEARFCTGPAGLALKMEGTKAFGVVLARRVARRLARPVRVFAASLVADDPIECAVDELVVSAEGAPRQGRWGIDLANEHGDDWSNLCDGKAYFAVSACLDHAIASVLGEAHERREIFLVAPASLGAARLDEIARQVRLADDAHVAVMAGRTSVRIRTAGATVTSFVSAAELEILRTALGTLRPTK